MRSGVLVLAALAACGRLDFTPRTSDGGTGDGPGGSDAAPDAFAPLGPFGAPMLVSLPVAGAKLNPSMTADGLELYFVAMNGASYDLFVASRGSTGAGWSSARALTEICSSTVTDSDPSISADGLTLYFSSLSSGTSELYVSTRASRMAMWGAPALVSELDTTGNNYGVAVDTSALRLVMASDRGSTAQHLFAATRASTTAAWSAPAALASVNSTKADATPSLAGAGLDLVFISARTDASYDLYEATRTDAGATFGAPAALTMLNTTGHEGGPWLSEDRRTLLFESDRSGQNEIYMTTR